MPDKPLEEYKIYPEHHRYAAQLARDFIDMQLPGEVRITFVPTRVPDGRYDQIQSIVIRIDDAQQTYTPEPEEEQEPTVGGFSAQYTNNRLRLVKPTVADLEDEGEDNANQD